MNLTYEEEQILDGKQGYIAQKAMKFLIKYGEAAGAERLVDIDGTVDFHPGVAWDPESSVTIEEIEVLASRGEKFKVPTFANKPAAPAFIVDGWEDCGVWPQNEADFHEEALKKLKPFIRMGMIPTLSCDYYLISSYLPTVGQHCSWCESSAIPWANAILGAKANYDGCFEAAYLGKIPAYDMQLDENRAATHLVECRADLTSDMDYELFGWAVGEAVGVHVPVITGIGKPDYSQLIKMNAALNTGGQVRMYHVPGLTPESPDLERTPKTKQWADKVTIQNRDLRKVYDLINYATNSSVDFVYLGCPHYNIMEIQRVVTLLKGRKCRVPLWIMTSPGAFKLAEMMGYRKAITQAGGVLMSGTCPGMMNGCMPPADVMATDSAKQNYYITGFLHPQKIDVWYGTPVECIEAALTGKWNGSWRSK